MIDQLEFDFGTVSSSLWALKMDPVVRAKVQMTKTSQDLQVHVPPEHLVKELGGNNDWSWHFTPVPSGENEPQQDSATKKKLLKQREQLIATYESVTRKWAKSDGKDEALNLTRELCTWRLRVHAFEIDPYIRGRSVYHRHGNIVGNGLVSFEYPNKSKPDEWEGAA